MSHNGDCMNIPVELKHGSPPSQSMASQAWTKGILVSTVQAADYRPYAVIQTEHGEFDLVSFNEIRTTETV
jgi:hypothetical protein